MDYAFPLFNIILKPVTRRNISPGELYDIGSDQPKKLQIHIAGELTDEASIVARWHGADIMFNTLGTTRARAGSAAAFKVELSSSLVMDSIFLLFGG